MKNNNFLQSQTIPNYPLNKNPSRIQNFNYMFYLIPENPQIYNFQNLASPLLPLGYIPSYPQTQFTNVNNIQNILPLFYNIGLNNLLQLSLINSYKALAQNQNLLPNISNINNFQKPNQNIFPNNFFLNRKTFNPNHQEIENESPNQIKKDDSNDNNENNNLIENEEENNISPIKSDLKVESNSEEKSIENIEEENIIKENKNSEEKIEEILEEKDEKSEKNEITTNPLEEKEKQDKNENQEKTKKKKKRRNNYKELLYDTILEHIGKEEKNDKENDIQLDEEEIYSLDNGMSNKKEENQKNKKTQNSNTQRNKPKARIKNGKHSRKKQHRITLKNNKDILADLEENKNNEDNNSKFTKVIFHGKDYEKTKNVIDFMKYNFDFILDEQYKSKKLITDYSQQHVDIKNINANTNIYENYNYSEQHLDEIKIKWSREKFLGDDEKLKKAINAISDSFNERKIYTNQEKYLDIIKNNNYNVDEFGNKKKKV